MLKYLIQTSIFRYSKNYGSLTHETRIKDAVNMGDLKCLSATVRTLKKFSEFYPKTISYILPCFLVCFCFSFVLFLFCFAFVLFCLFCFALFRFFCFVWFCFCFILFVFCLFLFVCLFCSCFFFLFFFMEYYITLQLRQVVTKHGLGKKLAALTRKIKHILRTTPLSFSVTLLAFHSSPFWIKRYIKHCDDLLLILMLFKTNKTQV